MLLILLSFRSPIEGNRYPLVCPGSKITGRGSGRGRKIEAEKCGRKFDSEKEFAVHWNTERHLPLRELLYRRMSDCPAIESHRFPSAWVGLPQLPASSEQAWKRGEG